MARYFSCLTILIFIFCSCKNNKDRIKPVISDITESVYASAKVKATNQYDVYSTVSGVLEKVMVRAGDSVKPGDPLFLLDKNTAGLNSENSKLALELSEANSGKQSDLIKELQLQVNSGRRKYLQDSLLFVRQKNLWNDKIGSRLDYEQRQLAFETSRNDYHSALSQLRQAKKELSNTLERARVNYNTNRKVESYYMIRSSIAGRVYNVVPEKGDMVTPQVQLAVIGKSDSFYLTMQVDENDMVKVHKGQRVEITMDSYRGKVFEGTVSRIYPIMDQSSRTFRVDAVFTDPPSTLYPNLTAETNIILSTKKRVMIIPRTYLVEDQYVLVSPTERKKVITGLKDYRKVEILSGVDTTDYIYKP